MAVLVTAERLRDFCRTAFTKAGLTPEHAAIVADTMVEADLRGVDTHGVMRFSIYIRRIANGLINTDPKRITLLAESPTTSLFDGADSQGQVLGVMAMNKAIELAGENGIGIAGVRNSNHIGTAAYYAEMPLKQDMIGFACTNTAPQIVPFGGAEPALGNNPLSIAVPAASYPPVVLDMAMSVVASGKIRRAALEGKPIPEGWVVDAEGMPSTDPYDHIDPDRKGSLLPFAGHKGSGLAVMIEMLAGVLMGPIFGTAVTSAFSLDATSHSGQMYMALSIDRFCDPAEFKTRVDRQIRMLKSCRPAKGVAEVLYPGELEARIKKERLQKGIPLSEAVAGELKELGEKYGVVFPAPGN